MMWTLLWIAAAVADPSDAPVEEDAVEGDAVEGEVDGEEVPEGPDRSGPPEVIPAEALALPEPEVHDLGGGVEAWHVRVPAVRKVAVHVVLHAGSVELDGAPTYAHRATGWMMDVAAGDLDAGEMSADKDVHELDLWSRLSLHQGGADLQVPREHLAHGLELLRLVLHEPTFPKKDLKRYLIDQELFYTVEGPSSQRALASSTMAYAWFPADHPYGARPDLSELDAIKPRVLEETWERWRQGGPVTILVVGDVDFDAVEAPLRSLAEGLGRPGERPEQLEVPAPPARVLAVDLPGQEQVAIRMRLPGPPVAHPDRAALEATNWVYGGNFLSRLNTNLREEKGFTYGAYTRFRSGHTWGNVTLVVDVAVENVAAAVDEIRHELDRVVDEGVTAAELSSARRALTSEWNETLQTAGSAVSLYSEALDEGRTVAELRADVEALDTLTPDASQRVAEAWWGDDQPRVWVFVGDREALAPQLDEAGLEATWIEPTDAILGAF